MGNLRMNADQISYKGGNTPMTVEEALKNSAGEAAVIEQLQQDVSDLNGNKANKADIATEFSDLTNYNAGDLVYYDGALYEFQVDHLAGVWETSEVIQKDLSDIVTMLKSGLNKIKIIPITAPSNLSSTAIGADVAIPIDAGYNGWLVIGIYLYAYGQNRGILECFSISTIVNNTITLLSLNKELASGYDSAIGFAMVADPS